MFLLNIVVTFLSVMQCQDDLVIDYNDPITRSNKCKTKCVDEGKTYCVNADKTGGECFRSG